MNYIFDPLQFKYFGQEYIEGENFSCRYQFTKRFPFNSLYVPLGPLCRNAEGVHEALKSLENFKRTRIVIDLPLILDRRIVEEVNQIFLQHDYKKKPYIINSDETLILRNGDYSPEKKTRYYIRKANSFNNIKCYNGDIDEIEMKKLYEIYSENGRILNYTPKSYEAMKTLVSSQNSMTLTSSDKKSGKMCGYATLYISEFRVSQDILPDKCSAKVAQLLFSNTTELGRDLLTGYVLYDSLIRKIFDENLADIIDLHGAGRSRNSSFITFKNKFAKEFVSLPGSYVKFNMF